MRGPFQKVFEQRKVKSSQARSGPGSFLKVPHSVTEKTEVRSGKVRSSQVRSNYVKPD